MPVCSSSMCKVAERKSSGFTSPSSLLGLPVVFWLGFMNLSSVVWLGESLFLARVRFVHFSIIFVGISCPLLVCGGRLATAKCAGKHSVMGMRSGWMACVQVSSVGKYFSLLSRCFSSYQVHLFANSGHLLSQLA